MLPQEGEGTDGPTLDLPPEAERVRLTEFLCEGRPVQTTTVKLTCVGAAYFLSQ